jgi:hypothetical protein
VRGTLLALAGITALATACGSAAAHSAHHTTHHTTQTTQPPDAYLTTGGVRTKMATGSSCWTVMHGDSGSTACSDSVGWEQYPALPRIGAKSGDRVTVSFGFSPDRPIEVDYGGHSTYISASPRPTLTVPGRGILSVAAHGSQGDVSYGIRIVPRSG